MEQRLRPYQEEAKRAIYKEWDRGRKRTLLVMPTGAGKTVVFGSIAKDLVGLGKNVLILAHRGELLSQAADKLESMTGIRPALEKADETAVGTDAKIVTASVQTLYRDNRLEAFPPDHFDCIIVDEAHHVMADTYQKILSYFRGANVLGVTATPSRNDQKDLAEFFNSKAYEYTMKEAVRDGYLCKTVAKRLPLQLDITGVSMYQGDFAEGETGEALRPYLSQIADILEDYCQGHKTVIFTPLIKTSVTLAKEINDRTSLIAAQINGNSVDRQELLEKFEKGDIDVLCNAMLLTEGWDCPSCDCIVVLRPTHSEALYRQMVGRGMRLCEGKDHLLLLDFLWLTYKYDVMGPASLVAESEDYTKRINEKLRTKGSVDLSRINDEIERDIIAEREAALLRELEENARREEERKRREEERKRREEEKKLLAAKREEERKLLEAKREEERKRWEEEHKEEIQFARLQNEVALKTGLVRPVSIGTFAHATKRYEIMSAYFEPIFAWEEELPTEKQLEFIAKRGLDVFGVKSKGQATKMIDLLIKRQKAGLASPKQLRVIDKDKYPFEHIQDWSFEKASAAIDDLSQNRWICTDTIRRKYNAF